MNDQVDDRTTGAVGFTRIMSNRSAPVEARVAALESVLVEHGLFDTEALDAIVAHFEHNLGPLNGAKVVARAGSIRRTSRGCSPMARQRSPSWVSAAPKAITWWSWRTHPTCTTWSCARCARVTRGRFSVYRLPGTSSLHIGRVPCVNPGCCSRRWARRSPTTSRSACGTSSGWRSVTSSCPNGLRERRTSREEELATLSLATRWSGSNAYERATT